MSFQQVLIVGRLGKNPEMRYLQDGTPVTNFSLAVDSSYNRQDGTKVKQTTWIRVSVWRKLAEDCNKYLKKGREALVIGTLSGDKVERDDGSFTIVPKVYKGNDGIHKSSFEITAQSVKFLGGRGDSGPAEADEIKFDADAEGEIAF